MGKDGSFRIDELIPATSYKISAIRRETFDKKGIGRGFKSFTLAADFAAKDGQIQDLGIFDVDLGKPILVTAAIPVSKASAVKPVEAATVPIRGRILDLQGRPVVGSAGDGDAGGLRPRGMT